MKNILSIVAILLLILNYSFAADTFDDLFEDIDYEESDINEEETDDDFEDAFDDFEDDMHEAAAPEEKQIPKADFNVYEEWDDAYLSIDWDIDIDEYSPLVLITRDLNNYHSEHFGEDIHLDSPWLYNVRLQINQDGEYVQFQEETVENKNINYESMWDPETGPLLYSILFIAIIISLAFSIYNIKNKNEI